MLILSFSNVEEMQTSLDPNDTSCSLNGLQNIRKNQACRPTGYNF